MKSRKTKFNLRQMSFGTSRAYLFEYALLLIALLVVINIVAMMFQELIGKPASFIQNSFFLPFIPYGYGDMTVGLLSALIIVLPLSIVLIQRTASAESLDAGIKNIAWRKGLLNVFLTISSLWAIVSLVVVISGVLNYLSLAGVTDASYDWREALENIFRAVFLILAVWAFSSDYRSINYEAKSKVMHIFRYSLVGLSLVAGVLFAVFPYMNNRNQVIDQMISNDLYEIQSSVNNQYYTDGTLFDSLDQIGMTEQAQSRSQKYKYSYEKISKSEYKLCAVFLSDAREEDGVFPMVNTAIYPGPNNNFYVHDKGEECYELSVEGYYGPEMPVGDKVQPSSETPETLDAELDYYQ